MYFFLMFLTTYSTTKLHEAGNAWHSGWWIFKLFLLILSTVVPVIFPSGLVQLYGMYLYLQNIGSLRVINPLVDRTF